MTAESVLQEPVTLDIGGEQYQVARPVTGTIIEMSGMVSQLPIAKDKEDRMKWCLAFAKDCRAIAEIIAILIRGYGRRFEVESRIERKCFGIFTVRRRVKVDKVKELAEKLLATATTEELFRATEKLLDMQHLGFFFSLITSLSEANILRSTVEESNQTIASGH